MFVTTTHDPDLHELSTRLSEAEHEIDRAREACRTLLSTLTDCRIALDSATRAFRDFDAREKGGAR